MDAISQLNDLADAHNREKYPNIPAHARPKAKYSDSTANKLTRAVIDWLQLNGYWATRVNTQGRFIQGQQFTDVLGRKRQLPGAWVKGTTQRGTADIHAVVNGMHVSIEVKVGKDRISKEQRDTMQAIQDAGGIYLIVRNFDDFMTWFREFNK